MIGMMRAKTYLSGLVALLCLATTHVWAQANCVSPGVILDVRSTQALVGNAPELTITFEKSGTTLPATIISRTTSRIRIQMPSVGLLPNEKFTVEFVDAKGRTKSLANARTCDFTTGGTGGGAGGGTNGGTGEGVLGNTASGGLGDSTPFQAATRFEVAAPSGAPEIVLMGNAGQVARAEAAVIQAGGIILRRRSLPGLGLGMATIDLGGALTLSTLRGDLARRNIDVAAEPHHVYALSEGERNAFARELSFGSAVASCQLGSPVRIGLIDGPVDTRHPALRAVRIETSTVLGRRDRPASSDHATGISGLIAAQEFGLAQGAQIISVTAVTRAGTREIAKLESIAAALDLLVSRNVDIVNMSLAGPSNAALARAIERAASRGVLMVASVGNNRNAPVAYPASDPNVIGVTAVDAGKRLYRHASRGRGVDFAAPGVDLRVPTGRNGSAFRSGTSFASAALTAIIAVELSKNGGDPTSIRRALSARAEDLGRAGPDLDFGFGLAQSAGC